MSAAANNLLKIIASLSVWLHERHVDIRGYIQQEALIEVIRQELQTLNDIELQLIASDLQKLSQYIVNEQEKRETRT